MFPPLFEALRASSDVRTHFGNEPRVYVGGEAPDKPATPYVVWQTIAGSPENYLDKIPDSDGFTTQVDVYASSSGDHPLTALRLAAKAVRDAIEPVAYIVGYPGEFKEQATKLYRYSFVVDWITSR